MSSTTNVRNGQQERSAVDPARFSEGDFQVAGELDAEKEQDLRNSLRRHGFLREKGPVVVDDEDTIIDGHHRVQICADEGISIPERGVIIKQELLNHGIYDPDDEEHRQQLNRIQGCLSTVGVVTPPVARRLLARFGSYSAVVHVARAGTDEDGYDKLVSVGGVSTRTAAAIRRELLTEGDE